MRSTVFRDVIVFNGGLKYDVRVEDEEPGMEDEDNEPINPLVDALFDEIETLRMQVSPSF